jgi:CubicO group peptidase (beta-lactamase class C family)
MPTSRRTFLKRTALGSIAFASPALVAESAAIVSLPRSTPEAEGVSSSAILAFLDGVAKSTSELHSFMLVRHGKVIAEGWWNPYAAKLKHTMYSMSKSFTSTAVGLAQSEGKLSVEDKVISFFPDDLPANISDNLAALRIKHLLSMAVGNEKEPTGTVVKEDNWARTFLAQSITHEPGTQFLYNSAATYMCSAIVQKVTGQRVIDYLTPRLFEPLGIAGMTWETCPRGINTGGWGLSIQTEGLAKFGQLYLQKGQWNSRQLIPAKWVEEATTFKIQQPAKPSPKHAKNQDDWQQGYCYQFWRCQHNAVRGDGAFGQFTVMMPDQDAVVIMTGESKDLQGELDLVWQHLLPALQSKALPADAATHAKLTAALQTLALPLPKCDASSSIAAMISGKTFVLDKNELGLTSIAFEFSNGSCTLHARASDASHRIVHGAGQWQLGETQMPGTPPRLIAGNPGTKSFKLAAASVWKDASTLELTWRFIETPHHDTVTCKFDGDQVTIRFLNSIAALGGGKKDPRTDLHGKLA